MSDVTGILQFENGGITNKTKIEQLVSFEDKTIMNINTSGNKLGNVIGACEKKSVNSANLSFL